MSVLTWVLVVGGVAFSVFMAWLLAPVEAALMRDRAATDSHEHSNPQGAGE